MLISILLALMELISLVQAVIPLHRLIRDVMLQNAYRSPRTYEWAVQMHESVKLCYSNNKDVMLQHQQVNELRSKSNYNKEIQCYVHHNLLNETNGKELLIIHVYMDFMSLINNSCANGCYYTMNKEQMLVECYSCTTKAREIEYLKCCATQMLFKL